MLTAKPTGFMSRTFEIARDGRSFGVITQAAMRERAEIVLDGVAYQMQNQLIGSDFLLHSGGQLLARASKRTFRRAFDLEIAPGGTGAREMAYTVNGGMLSGNRYTLSENGTVRGSASKTLFLRDARATFDEDIPEPVQVFLLWIGLMMWRRERESG
jgi:hypothetical protein